jgi:hypothetical protein
MTLHRAFLVFETIRYALVQRDNRLTGQTAQSAESS